MLASVVLVLGLTVCVGISVCSKLPLSQSTDLFAKLQEESYYTEGQRSYFARKRIIDGAIANATGNERPELMTDRERSATEHTPPLIIVEM